MHSLLQGMALDTDYRLVMDPHHLHPLHPGILQLYFQASRVAIAKSPFYNSSGPFQMNAQMALHLNVSLAYSYAALRLAA